MAGRAATAVKSKPKAKATAASKTKKSSSSAAGTATLEAPAKPRRRVKAETRTCIYWAVFNEDLKRVAVFEFAQKAEAEKRAQKLIKASGEHHFIQKIKAVVPA